MASYSNSRKWRTAASLLLVLIPSLLSISATPAPRTYIESLVQLTGTPYETLNCSQYVCIAKRHRFCAAADFWRNGCNGDAALIQDTPSFEEIDRTKLQPGDVVAFHQVHLGVYIGNGVWMDSDFRHNGVGVMQRNHRPGGWFYGEVKVLRWKDLSSQQR